MPSWQRDEAAAEVFLHTAFTVGTTTLVRGVRATPAGAVVELRPDGSWTSRPWQTYRYDPEPITTPEEKVVFSFAPEMAALINSIFPLYDIGMGWLLPASIGFVLGLVLKTVAGKKAT